jgi:hypothetical protein
MGKPAKKKRGGPKPPPAVVLRAKTPQATYAVPIQKAPPNPQGGRPKYELTPELAKEICHRIAHGAVITRLGDDMPSHSVIFNWRDEHEWFSELYARAVDDRHDYWAAEILTISDTPEPGIKTEHSPKFGTKTITGDMIEHRRLRVDSRKWLLSKTDRRFKDKVDVNHGGQADGAPIKTVALTTTDPVEAARVYQEWMNPKKD